MAASQIAQLLGQTVPLLSWFKLVNDTVTEPYLDEVFHVRQAQVYCAGHFEIWDPKITTPPGLYLVSYLFSLLGGCSLTVLRAQNLFALILVSTVVVRTYTARKAEDESWISASSINILLFPPLFFFSTLYYTDIMSTLSVLLFYWFFLHVEYEQKPMWMKGPILVVLGAISLLFRQTNIFWISVVPAALTFVKRIDRGQSVVKDSMHRRADGLGDSFWSVARTSFKMEVVYDLPVRDAWVEDYFKTIVSITTCTAGIALRRTHLTTLLLALLPYLTLLALFAIFIVWNGGVVLGDKSNHIATLHLPQMLYIWPFITFFSWPLLYPYLLTVPLQVLANIPSLAGLETALIFQRRQLLPRPWITALFVVIACVVVHFNTIVHPFTLADNRHYTFYVFRHLMRPAWVKYIVTPLYVVCGWACVQALGARQPPSSGTQQSNTKEKKKTPQQAANTVAQQRSPIKLPNGTTPATTSFLLIWLATSALQLITTPLVEPRYFILPWVFWRLHLPLQRPLVDRGEGKEVSSSWDHRMLLETGWLLAVNAVTGCIFLRWKFSWEQEVGAVQRFMW